MQKEHEEAGKPAEEPREKGTDWAGLEKLDEAEEKPAETPADKPNA